MLPRCLVEHPGRRPVTSRQSGRTTRPVAAAIMLLVLAAAGPGAVGAPVTPALAQAGGSADCAPGLVGDALYYQCVLSTTASAVDLAALPGVPPVNDDTVVWIQAWGGFGRSTRIVADATPARGGRAGFAQTVTTVGDYTAKYGATTLHYALGVEGVGVGSDQAAVGGGGSATLVTSVDPRSTAPQISHNVLAVAGGGGGSVMTGGFELAEYRDGGNGGVAMSNGGGQVLAAEQGQRFSWGGRPGGDGAGGQHVRTVGGHPGVDGGNGVGGQGGAIDGRSTRAAWSNVDLTGALGTSGAGGNGGCMTRDFEPFCISGAGGGGWGGGASGSNGNSGEYRRAAGGGGGSYAAPSTTSDDNAPTTFRSTPATDRGGAVVVTIKIQDLDLESTFCDQTTLSGTTGFRCILPFNWQFEIPQAYTGDDWLVTLQAVGGSGGNGGDGGRAQTTLTTTGLAGTTLHSWVGAQGSDSVGAGGGGGGATVVSTAASPWQGASAGQPGPDLLLVAGGGGGGVRLDGECPQEAGGAGGVAVTAGAAVVGDGQDGAGDKSGTGATWNGTAWTGGLSHGGSDGTNWLTVVGGRGGKQDVTDVAATVESVAAATPTQDGVGVPGDGEGDDCSGGGGGAGAATGGGGNGNSGDPGSGGGGGSLAAASDADPSSLPSWADDWLTLPDQGTGQVSLFFFQVAQAPPFIPQDGATLTTPAPTLGLETSTSGPFQYRISDETNGQVFLASRDTTNELWTLGGAGAMTPGHTYSWEVVDSSGATVQPARTFTLASESSTGGQGVVMEMRSMNAYATSSWPSYLKPDSGQEVPSYHNSNNVPSGCQATTNHPEPSCRDYKTTMDNPDSHDKYFTTATAVQATTNPHSINMDWVVFDPFGIGLSELFTLKITGALTVPVSGTYIFAIDSYGGGRMKLTAPGGSSVGPDPLIDSWGMISGNCTGKTSGGGTEKDSLYQVTEFNAAQSCVNRQGAVSGTPVTLEAGVAYDLEIDGFMSWLPGPFELLYTNEVLAADPAPVPGGWLSTACTSCPATTPGPNVPGPNVPGPSESPTATEDPTESPSPTEAPSPTASPTPTPSPTTEATPMPTRRSAGPPPVRSMSQRAGGPTGLHGSSTSTTTVTDPFSSLAHTGLQLGALALLAAGLLTAGVLLARRRRRVPGGGA